MKDNNTGLPFLYSPFRETFPLFCWAFTVEIFIKKNIYNSKMCDFVIHLDNLILAL